MQYNSKVNILRVTRTQDSLGSFTEVENVLHNNLVCRVVWTSLKEQKRSDKDTPVIVGKFFCRIVDINEKDRVQISGTTYRILTIHNADQRGRRLAVEFTKDS